ncbi:hypothetical protein [Aeromonas molluscorum]|uniref:hypothetical protein n=1 Tax=Aeromonas molluscorum TaxID=271417 RepID=UPI003F1BA7BF
MSRESGAGPERNGNGGGMSGNTGRGSGGSSSGGKGGGRNDSGGSGSKSSSSKSGSNKGKNDTASTASSRGGIGPIGGGSMYGGESVRNAMTKDNSNKNGGSKVSDRLPSVSKTLGTYKQSTAPSAPAYARPGYGDTLNAQRNQLAGPVSGGGPSSMGSAASYGMSEDDFNKSIGTDNFNGVIGNLQEKALRRTASEDDRSSMDAATRDYNNLRGAGVLGSAIAGKPGQWAAQQATNAAMNVPGDYLAGMTRKAAMEQLDKGRLIGQRGELGDGGVGDSAVKGGVSLLGAAIPGGSLITSGISSGLTVGAPGLGNLLNDINARLGNTISRDDTSQGSDRGYTPPPRQTPTSNNQAGDLTFDSNYYDPSRFNVTTGKRGY